MKFRIFPHFHVLKFEVTGFSECILGRGVCGPVTLARADNRMNYSRSSIVGFMLLSLLSSLPPNDSICILMDLWWLK